MDSINATTFSELTRHLPWLGLLILPIALGWVVWRSGSLHALHFRMWRLWYGKTIVADKYVKQFCDDQLSLIAFRFESGLGLRARTLKHTRRVIDWLQTHDEDISALRRVGHYFDLEKLRLGAVPGKWALGVLGFIVYGLAMAALLGVAGMLTSAAILQVKASGHWVAVTEDRVAALFEGAWSERIALTPALCAKSREDLPEKTALLPSDIDLFCRSFDDPKAKAFFATSVREQKLPFGILTGIFGSLGLVVWLELMRIIAARSLHKRLDSRLARSPLEILPAETDASRSANTPNMTPAESAHA